MLGPTYRFTVLTGRLIRYEWAADGQFEDRASTLAINRGFPVPQFRVVDEDDLEIIAEHFHLTYNKQRFSAGGLVVHFRDRHTEWGAPWRYGVTEDLNLGGTARTLDLCDGRCDMGQGVISRAGHAALDDSSSMLFDGDFVASRRPGDRVDGYLFCFGHDYRAAIRTFFALSGKQPVLPRYALGNWWSRYYTYHQDEYVSLMDKFRAHGIPLSVAVIDMDWHRVSHESVPHSGWAGYTWDKGLCPDPEAFGHELHKRNLKITLNDHPHNGIHSHEEAYEECILEILHRKLERIACDFWWIDWQQGPYSRVCGLDPLWLLDHFQYLDHEQNRSTTPLIFSRYAGPGSHRYPVGFSGDTVVSWASLAFQPEFTATASNIGYGMWSHDIGGHIWGVRDDELVTRWVQLGVFSPIFRLHSSLSRWTSKEPCSIGPNNVLSSTEDELLVQPMHWMYPDAPEAYSFPNQYIFGSELLVAPIVTPRDQRTNLASVKVWLPSKSRYVDLFMGTVYDDNREITLYQRPEEYPVLLSEGTILTLDADTAPGNGCLNPEALEIIVVVGRNAQAVILEGEDDDDDTQGDGNSTRRPLSHFTSPRGVFEAEGINRPVTFRFLSMTSIPQDLKVAMDGMDITSRTKVTVVKYPQTPESGCCLPVHVRI
ncbi:glycoside hydrolase superfamily [Aspergillus leporis]|uniref:alpha-glucosidase n=1 Tax=Aspergillus leporis TaxID=41062 RepID=A0A5N5WGT3_9EURO|nr:glycoside hydrolase superfamily [Aspergillus leporis]